VAAYASSSLAVGSHVITASYSGDANFLPATATLTEVVQDFTLAVPSSSPPSQTAQKGGCCHVQPVAQSFWYHIAHGCDPYRQRLAPRRDCLLLSCHPRCRRRSYPGYSDSADSCEPCRTEA
jgi:hypothetical protein